MCRPPTGSCYPSGSGRCSRSGRPCSSTRRLHPPFPRKARIGAGARIWWRLWPIAAHSIRRAISCKPVSGTSLSREGRPKTGRCRRLMPGRLHRFACGSKTFSPTCSRGAVRATALPSGPWRRSRRASPTCPRETCALLPPTSPRSRVVQREAALEALAFDGRRRSAISSGASFHGRRKRLEARAWSSTHHRARCRQGRR